VNSCSCFKCKWLKLIWWLLIAIEREMDGCGKNTGWAQVLRSLNTRSELAKWSYCALLGTQSSDQWHFTLPFNKFCSYINTYAAVFLPQISCQFQMHTKHLNIFFLTFLCIQVFFHQFIDINHMSVTKRVRDK
jgi:hypothetical protein